MTSGNAKHLDRIVIEMAKLTHGLDMFDVDQVLDKLRMFLKVSVRVDVTGPDFRHQLDGFAAHYGEPIDAPKRQ